MSEKDLDKVTGNISLAFGHIIGDRAKFPCGCELYMDFGGVRNPDPTSSTRNFFYEIRISRCKIHDLGDYLVDALKNKRGKERTMNRLMVLREENEGYKSEAEEERVENLLHLMENLDRQLIPWYIEEDGEQSFKYICKNHKNRLGVEFVGPKLEEIEIFYGGWKKQ